MKTLLPLLFLACIACGSTSGEPTADVAQASAPPVICQGSAPSFAWFYSFDGATAYASTSNTDGALWANGAGRSPSSGAISYPTGQPVTTWTFSWDGTALHVSNTRGLAAAYACP